MTVQRTSKTKLIVFVLQVLILIEEWNLVLLVHEVKNKSKKYINVFILFISSE